MQLHNCTATFNTLYLTCKCHSTTLWLYTCKTKHHFPYTIVPVPAQH